MRKTVKYVISALIVVAFMSPSLICLIVPLLVNGFFSVVTSGSMEPAIPVGSVTIFRKINPEDVKVGDVIVFETGESRTAHRVIEKVVENGFLYFRTQGDANENPDEHIVKPEDICGALMLTIPYYGYLLHYAGTPIGFALMVIIPAAIIIASEVISIIKHRREAKGGKGGDNLRARSLAWKFFSSSFSRSLRYRGLLFPSTSFTNFGISCNFAVSPHRR